MRGEVRSGEGLKEATKDILGCEQQGTTHQVHDIFNKTVKRRKLRKIKYIFIYNVNASTFSCEYL